MRVSGMAQLLLFVGAANAQAAEESQLLVQDVPEFVWKWRNVIASGMIGSKRTQSGHERRATFFITT